MQEVASREMDADLERLQVSLRQLKIQYDMFFAGSLPKQPLELRSEIEGIIKRYAHAPIRSYALRFQFNTLVGRYNSLSELWAKTMRRSEEGDRTAPVPYDRSRASEAAEAIVARYTVRNPAEEREQLGLLHAKYLETRRRSGGIDGTIPFETFLRGIAAQAQRLREKNGCDKVELRIVVAGRKVELKARPGR